MAIVGDLVIAIGLNRILLGLGLIVALQTTPSQAVALVLDFGGTVAGRPCWPCPPLTSPPTSSA
ncbi:MAG: hypothetical protein R3C14_21035 [Caldilineaceae bacterium]